MRVEFLWLFMKSYNPQYGTETFVAKLYSVFIQDGWFSNPDNLGNHKMSGKCFPLTIALAKVLKCCVLSTPGAQVNS